MDVIEALTKNAKIIPYRNHKLTQLMQDSLGGTSKTLMFMNCSPSSSNVDETSMSLKYAQRAKQRRKIGRPPTMSSWFSKGTAHSLPMEIKVFTTRPGIPAWQQPEAGMCSPE